MKYPALLFTATLLVATTPAAGQEIELLPSDGAAGDWFGASVAISGSVVIVGAFGDDDNGGNSGSAYLSDSATGTQLFKLLPSDGEFGDAFGISVAISGTIVIVGAPGDNAYGYDSGSAYLFDTTAGAQIVKLLPSDGAPSDYFGHSVSVSGATAIIGAYGDDDNGNYSGSAYLFDTSTGTQIAKLLASDGAPNDLFGGAVAISGSTAIIGAREDDDSGFSSGSAYLFDTTTGAQIAKLLASDGEGFDFFGHSVAISGTIAIVGAPLDAVNGYGSGSAYLFDTTTGTQIAKLVPSDGAASDWFGESVAISGTTAIVGADQDDDNGTMSGSAYIFDTTTGAQIAKLLPSNGAAHDWLGVSVAISGSTAIAGASFADANGMDSGSAYLFDLSNNQDPCITVQYCASLPNSSGLTGAITWTGSCVVADNDFTLVMRSCPAGQPGIVLYGASQISHPFGNGILCVGLPMVRLHPPLIIDNLGLASKVVDLEAPPSAGGAITAGSAWNFQMWMRDPLGGGAGFTLTNGMAVTFQ